MTMSLTLLAFVAVVFALVAFLRVARIGALVAFLFAGVVSGPYVLNLFHLTDTWTLLGDLGIMFLWFTMGLNINMKRLWTLRHSIFGFGAAQVLMVATMLFPLLFGLTGWPIIGCVMVALMLSMSSTSEDMQMLADRNQINTDMGRQTFSILLFQDLLAIPLLAKQHCVRTDFRTDLMTVNRFGQQHTRQKRAQSGRHARGMCNRRPYNNV